MDWEHECVRLNEKEVIIPPSSFCSSLFFASHPLLISSPDQSQCWTDKEQIYTVSTFLGLGEGCDALWVLTQRKEANQVTKPELIDLND